MKRLLLLALFITANVHSAEQFSWDQEDNQLYVNSMRFGRSGHVRNPLQRSLDLSTNRLITADFIRDQASLYPNIEEIIIGDSFSFDNSVPLAALIVSLFPRLKRIKMGHCNSKHIHAFFKRNKEATGVDFECDSYTPGEGLTLDDWYDDIARLKFECETS